jgi:putative heme-binding domain-containing protein
LPPEDARLDALIAQRLGSLNSAKPDEKRGTVLFNQHCASCHKFRDTGGNLGPSLDGIASRNPARLIEDILDPSRNIDPAFRVHTLTLKNGETKSGLGLREEAGRVFLSDPASSEKLEFARADVTEISASPVSAMPAIFDSVLAESELFDLIAFLRSAEK